MYGCNQPFIPGLMTDTVYSVLRNYCTKKSADTVQCTLIVSVAEPEPVLSTVKLEPKFEGSSSKEGKNLKNTLF